MSSDPGITQKLQALRSICVFCGSSPGARPEYASAAARLGRELAVRGVTLVYGGAHVGLMGALADAALEAGGKVIGVIPQSLVDKEVAHIGLTKLHVVRSMHERKALIADLSDGFIALPGGMGTLEEFFEVLTWGQLGMHARPCGFLNIAGFFDGLLEFLNTATSERFLKPVHREMILAETEITALLDRMAAYRAPTVSKWLDREES